MPNPQPWGPHFDFGCAPLARLANSQGALPTQSLWDILWLLCSDLSGLSDPTSSYANATIAPSFIGACNPPGLV
jgi:hypothetical protein